MTDATPYRRIRRSGRRAATNKTQRVPSGTCPSCHTEELVAYRHWFRASPPKCSRCGLPLMPGSIVRQMAMAGHSSRQPVEAALKTTTNKEINEQRRKEGFIRTGKGKGSTHTCYIKDCNHTILKRWPTCRPCSEALSKGVRHQVLSGWALICNAGGLRSSEPWNLAPGKRLRIALALANRELAKKNG